MLNIYKTKTIRKHFNFQGLASSVVWSLVTSSELRLSSSSLFSSIMVVSVMELELFPLTCWRTTTTFNVYSALVSKGWSGASASVTRWVLRQLMLLYPHIDIDRFWLLVIILSRVECKRLNQTVNILVLINFSSWEDSKRERDMKNFIFSFFSISMYYVIECNNNTTHTNDKTV